MIFLDLKGEKNRAFFSQNQGLAEVINHILNILKDYPLFFSRKITIAKPCITVFLL
jgi:hypothetical protein